MSSYRLSVIISVTLHVAIVLFFVLWDVKIFKNEDEIRLEQIDVIDNESFLELFNNVDTSTEVAELEENQTPVPEAEITEPAVIRPNAPAQPNPDHLGEPIFQPSRDLDDREIVNILVPPSRVIPSPLSGEETEIEAESESADVLDTPQENPSVSAETPEAPNEVSEVPAANRPIARPAELTEPTDRNIETTVPEVAVVPENVPSASSEQPEVDANIDSLLFQVIGEASDKIGASIKEEVTQNWNRATIADKDNFADLVVVLQFPVNDFGEIVGSVELVDPISPSNDHLIAFEAARTAVLKTAPFEMPDEVGPEGVIWQLVFDPKKNSVASQ